MHSKMDIVFSTQANSSSASNNPYHGKIQTICRVSSRNTIAFTTSQEIEGTYIHKYKWGSIVYVTDVFVPWQIYCVTSSKNTITALEWDNNGERLLIGDSMGHVQVWGQKNHLLSDWYMLHNVEFAGENIVAVNFFSNGRLTTFSSEKRDHLLYMEKFQTVKYVPSVRRFGGLATQGCLLITNTGLLCAFLLPEEQTIPTIADKQNVKPLITPEIIPVTKSLALNRNYLSTAALSFGKTTENGYFRVAVANDDCKQRTMIQCFRVSLHLIHGKLTITSQSLPKIYLHEGIERIPSEYYKITHLLWTLNEEGDSLIVVEKSPIGSLVQLWNLHQRSTPIHKLLQPNKTDVFKNITWTNQFNFKHSAHVLDLRVSKISFDGSYIFLLFSDNTIQIMSMDFKVFSQTSISSLDMIINEPINKLSRIDRKFLAFDITYLGHLLLVLDNNSQVHAFRAPLPFYEQCTNQMSHIAYKTALIEYCIITGYDPSDLFLTFRTNFLDSIIEKLTDNFTRQPTAVQQYYYVNFLTMKTNLYRLLLNGQSKANDLNSLIMLHSILISFKSLLRPADLTNHDKGPAENLAVVLSDSVPDVDKVLLNLDAKDFTVEPSTLQSLQQLIQWVADLALNILARLPQATTQNSQNKNNGYDICKDNIALNGIRELLVMIRIWGLLNTNCWPNFSRSASENVDILATLYRLLTRLALNPLEPDDLLLDECAMLPTLVTIPQLNLVSSVTPKNSAALFLNSLPCLLPYNDEPDFLQNGRSMANINDNDVSNNVVLDSIRNIVLGKSPLTIRYCYRCGTCSNVGTAPKTVAINAWEQRWIHNCRCGGSWVLRKNSALKDGKKKIK